MAYNDWAAGEEITSEKLNETMRQVVGRVFWAGDGALANFTFPAVTFGSSGCVYAFGRQALGKLTDARDVIAIGDLTMQNSILTRDNIGIGSRALRNVQADTIYYDASQQAGTRNVGIGSNTLLFTNKGYAHTAVGRNAGGCVVGGTGLTAIGYGAVAGYQPIGLTGDQENWSAFGTGANEILTTAVGYRAMEVSTASTTVAVGGRALNKNKRSEGNTAVGASALAALDTGTGNNGGTVTSININGTYSWSPTILTITTASAHGLAVGDTAYIRLLDGPAATFSTDQAPGVVATVTSATVFTINAPIYPATLTSATGNATLYSKETAAQIAQNSNNTGLGFQAGAAVLTGSLSTYLGYAAGFAATVTRRATIAGAQAAQASTSNDESTTLGYFAAGNMASCTQVTAIGSSALRNNVDGTSMTAAYTNISGLGYDARVSGSNQVQLGNTGSTVYAQAAVQTRSDARDKADIEDTPLGLEFLTKVRPRQWRWDIRQDYATYDTEGNPTGLAPRDGSMKRNRFHQGVIAQELKATIDEMGVDFGGFQDHKVAGGDDIFSVGYEEFVGPLIRAVQELNALNDQLVERVKVLENAKS